MQKYLESGKTSCLKKRQMNSVFKLIQLLLTAVSSVAVGWVKVVQIYIYISWKAQLEVILGVYSDKY